MFKKIKWIIYTRPFNFFLYVLIRLYTGTFRFKVINENVLKTLLDQGKPVLLCGWHQQFFLTLPFFRSLSKYNPSMMISRSKDGQIIASIAKRYGWLTARGSSSRGGKEAMQEIINHLKVFKFAALIPDGPRGPIGIVKPGVIKIAGETDAFIVPFWVKAQKAWFFNSWDKFMLPKPFSEVILSYEEPLKFEATVELNSFETQRKKLEDIMKPNLLLNP